jgi:hypothetical protein
MKLNMNVQKIAAVLAATTVMSILPTTAFAQRGDDDRRQEQRQREEQRRREQEKQREEARRRNNDNRRGQSQADADKRQKTKNDWRNLATLAGGATVIGLLKKDPTITFAGAAGALYSLSRYEQDRKSQSQQSKARADLFSKPYIYRDGQRYDRKLVTQNGQKFYRFERHR